MSSGFSGGGGGGDGPDFNGGFAGRSLSTGNPQVPYRSQVLGEHVSSQTVNRRSDLTGKRSLAEFQAHQLQQQLQQQQEQRLSFYLRNVKQRNFQQPDFSPRHGYPIHQQIQPQSVSFGYGNGVILPSSISGNPSTIPPPPCSFQNLVSSNTVDSAQLSGEKKMMNRLQELEKQLLDDVEEEDEQGDSVSVITNINSEWSETIENLLSPSPTPPTPTPTPATQIFISPSPTSSSSSCSSSAASPTIICPKQTLMEAASAISEGKTEVAAEILTRLTQVANVKGTSEQRLTSYMVSALKSRINPTDYPPPISELYTKEHNFSTQMLYEGSPCFKLGFMAANLAILEAISDHPSGKLHLVDFDVGKGSHFLHLIHSLAARKKGAKKPSLKITAFVDISCDSEERLKVVGDMLKAEADKVGVILNFNLNHRNTFPNLENLIIDPDEALAVNFAFQLYKLPDESVTTENLRDNLLRQVKSLSPTVVTMVEQDMNVNTASFTGRVAEVYAYYGSLFDSLEATVPNRENPERVRVEEGLGRRAANSVACEGKNRSERCEVLGKWMARMSMAGFKGREMGRVMSDSLRGRMESGTRGSPGFTVMEEKGSICFGWKGRTLTVASAWH